MFSISKNNKFFFIKRCKRCKGKVFLTSFPGTLSNFSYTLFSLLSRLPLYGQGYHAQVHFAKFYQKAWKTVYVKLARHNQRNKPFLKFLQSLHLFFAGNK
jgi:hypothetical protein